LYFFELYENVVFRNIQPNTTKHTTKKHTTCAVVCRKTYNQIYNLETKSGSATFLLIKYLRKCHTTIHTTYSCIKSCKLVKYNFPYSFFINIQLRKLYVQHTTVFCLDTTFIGCIFLHIQLIKLYANYIQLYIQLVRKLHGKLYEKLYY